MTDHDCARNILIDFAESVGYDEGNPKHEQAFKTAYTKLIELIEMIDNAERC